MGLLKNKKSSNKPAVKWIYRRTKKYIPYVVLLSLVGVAISVCNVILAMTSKKILDAATGAIQGNFTIFAVKLLAVVLSIIILTGVQSILNTYTNGKLTIHLRNYAFSVINKRKYFEISAYHSGDLLNRITSDNETISGCIVNTIPSIFSMLSQIIGGVSALIILDKRIALIILVAGISVPAIGRIFNRKFKSLHKELQVTEGKSRSFIQECFENIVIIKTFYSELPFIKKLNQYMDKNFKVKMKKGVVTVVTHLSIFGFFTIGYYLVLIWGADNIAKGLITYGTLNAFLQLITQLVTPLKNFSGIIPQYFSAVASAERIMELENGDFDKQLLQRDKLLEIEKELKYLKVSNVSFSYKDEGVLKHCSFVANKGEITAITGESGSGKSTIFKLILGLYEPQQGDIFINDNIKVDTSLRGIFAYVPQGNMVLSGSIRENISMCDESISKDEIMRAAKIAQIDELINSMPNGLDTELSERGAGLSEGQIQRIAIARAVITDAPILLLDEATSALDEETESKVLSNIKAMSNKTVLFVTHRHTSLMVCDSIIHVENGKFNKIK